MNDPILRGMRSAGDGKVLREPVEIIPLGAAQLCVDCNCITRSPNNHCLACGSHSTVKLAQILNRAVAQTSGSEVCGMFWK